MKRRLAPWIFTASALVALQAAFAGTDQHPKTIATFNGKVVSVADGDTLTVVVNGRGQVKVRLQAIDAPEKAQEFGEKSKQALSSKCSGRR